MVVITLKTAYSIQTEFCKEELQAKQRKSFVIVCLFFFMFSFVFVFVFFFFIRFLIPKPAKRISRKPAYELIELVSLSITVLKAKCHEAVAAVLLAA